MTHDVPKPPLGSDLISVPEGLKVIEQKRNADDRPSGELLQILLERGIVRSVLVGAERGRPQTELAPEDWRIHWRAWRAWQSIGAPWTEEAFAARFAESGRCVTTKLALVACGRHQQAWRSMVAPLRKNTPVGQPDPIWTTSEWYEPTRRGLKFLGDVYLLPIDIDTAIGGKRHKKAGKCKVGRPHAEWKLVLFEDMSKLDKRRDKPHRQPDGKTLLVARALVEDVLGDPEAFRPPLKLRGRYNIAHSIDLDPDEGDDIVFILDNKTSRDIGAPSLRLFSEALRQFRPKR